MKLFLISILLILVSYQSGIDKRGIIPKKPIIAMSADSSLNLRIEYPIAVEYKNIKNSDTILFNLKHHRLLVTPKGSVICENKLLFEIHPNGNIQKIFPFLIDEDLVIIYSFSTTDNDSGSSAKRISLKNNTIIWEKSIYGFSPERPVLLNEFIYLSTIGYIGKLSVKTGKFIWEFDNFFKNGNFINFNEPQFFDDSTVLFTEKNTSNSIGRFISIDNRNKKILAIKQ